MGIAEAVLDRLMPEMAPPDQKYGWTLDQAASQIEHLKPTGEEWRVAAAYLAGQVWAYRKISGAEDREAARLALSTIERAVEQYRARDNPRNQGSLGGAAGTLL